MNNLTKLLGKCCITGMALFLFSCNKYLDVQPEDKFLDNQVYGTATSVQNALNGIYLNLAKPALYGENMTSTTVDVMAQYYNLGTTAHVFYATAACDYTNTVNLGRITTIWSAAYKAILNINLFIYNVAAREDVLTPRAKQLMLGEAYGVRAFVALDMLRLFGPVYATDSTAPAIPYPVLPETAISAQLPANVVMDSIMKDIDRAQTLLAIDPVITEGVSAQVAGGEDNFFKLRNRRMNYYSVQALRARALLYRGNKQAALLAATTVIKEAAKWFPWVTSAQTAAGIASPDRVFSTELLFAVENYDMYTSRNAWFNASLGSTTLLLPLTQRLNTVYEGFTNDYRYRTWWLVDSRANLVSATFFKYADVTDQSAAFRKQQPLLRLSEMYFIAAECEQDDATAQGYLNTMRTQRGLPDIAISGNKQSLIGQEVQKEFWGEGQLFFYYKRLNAASVASGSAAGATVSMTKAKYVVPLPLAETDYR